MLFSNQIAGEAFRGHVCDIQSEISLKILFNFFKLILLVSIFTSYVVPIVVYQNMLLEGSL